ncbi:MAG: TetR family transcriptional regulator C-terminal domain-containing protein [Chloroflexota bacterium]|nr:TetR family transcriptional regulator C-terminal domain-containing protein [Chloroflexota bacterium]
MENPPEIWIQLFEHVAEHTRLYRAMLGKNGSSWFAARMREHTIKLMLERERLYEHQAEPRQQIEPAMPQELPGEGCFEASDQTRSSALDTGERFFLPA